MEEQEKLAEEGGQLEAFYIEAEKIGSELGIASEDAILAAMEALGTKVASASMWQEIEKIAEVRAIHSDPELNYLKHAAQYAPDAIGGAEIGVETALDNRISQYVDQLDDQEIEAILQED